MVGEKCRGVESAVAGPLPGRATFLSADLAPTLGPAFPCFCSFCVRLYWCLCSAPMAEVPRGEASAETTVVPAIGLLLGKSMSCPLDWARCDAEPITAWVIAFDDDDYDDKLCLNEPCICMLIFSFCWPW